MPDLHQTLITAGRMNSCLLESYDNINKLNAFLVSTQVLPIIEDFCMGYADIRSEKGLGKETLCLHHLNKVTKQSKIPEWITNFCLNGISENFLFTKNNASNCMKTVGKAMELNVTDELVELCIDGTKDNGAMFRHSDFAQCILDG